MKNYRLDIVYDGTRYEGWQRQKKTDQTIQGKIEAVLSRMCNKELEICGAGRTDAGVHAKGQVANVKMDTERSEDEIFQYVNQYLPEDIGIKNVRVVTGQFHSRFHAKEKVYCYRIGTGYPINVFERKYIWQLLEKLDIEEMKKAAGFLIGTHDFKSFCGNKNMKKSTIRTIRDIIIEDMGNEVRITYIGDGFLQYMIRIMTGTLVECGMHKRDPKEMKDILNMLDRSAAGMTAPACGLTLMHVGYEE